MGITHGDRGNLGAWWEAMVGRRERHPPSTLIFCSPKHIILRRDRHQEELCPFENPIEFRSGWEESLSS